MTRRELAKLRKDERRFLAAFAAPFLWGRWNATAQKHRTAGRPTNQEAVALFATEGAFDPESTRAALAACQAPVLLLTGEFGPPVAAAEFAEPFPDAALVVKPGAGHYPWLDDAGWFVATTAAFLCG